MTRRFRGSKASRAILLGLLAVAFTAAPVQAAPANSFSGEATVVDVNVASILNVTLGHAGPLPPTGGSDVDEMLNASVTNLPLTLSASVIRARTAGSGSTAESVARVAGLDLNLAGLVNITSTTLRSEATARCGANGAVVSGASLIEDLEINDLDINVSGAPNQEIDLGLIELVINERDSNVAANGSSGEITVNALRVTVRSVLGGVLAQVVISSAHADVTCPVGGGGDVSPRGAIGGPCADPAYYGIFDNTASSVALEFRFRWTNGSGVKTIKKTVPAGWIFRSWEHWAKPGTPLLVQYKNPANGNWVTLASDQAVKGRYPVCVYDRGFENPS